MGEFWHWSYGGVAIASVVAVYALASGRLLGVSSVYVNALLRSEPKGEVVSTPSELEAALRALTLEEFGDEGIAGTETAAPALNAEVSDLRRAEGRPLFLVGILLGAFAASLVRGYAGNATSLGEHFTARYGTNPVTAIVVLLLSGVLVGFGTRMAGGCTSGHGICGVARGERGSLLSTATFWSCGIAVTWGVTWLLGLPS